jgi:SNF2 family DNA or RNA helicase
MDFKKFLQHSGLDSKPYQEEGVAWCISREQEPSADQDQDNYCRGGIIADEMGLGKTIMMIGTIVSNFKMPNLIILPNVLIEQWKEQFQRTTGHSPIIYHGASKKILTAGQLQHIPIILTSYGTVLADTRRDKKLQQINWGRVICDEAHHLKNRRTKVAKAVGNLNTKIMWLISGTPIQNHINDLYSLFDILKIPKSVYINIDKLKDIMSKIVLKRTKKSVGIQLPSLYVNRINTKWANIHEQKLTEDIHDKLVFSLLKQKPLPRNMRLSMMLFARMLCIYPKLASTHLHKIRTMGHLTGDNFEGINHSSKMDSVVNTLVSRKDNGNRKIIFTNFSGEIDHLKNALTSSGLSVEYIDGRVTSKRRRQILKRDIDVLILQIKTGNEGLNLQQYNEIYFVTPDWNPQVEEQAIARCHRLGQVKEVHVFRFVMECFDEEDRTVNIEMYSESVQKDKREIEQKTMTC